MSSEMEFCFFECVCMFHQRGKSKAEYINKQKFRSRIRRSETLNLKVLKNTVTEQGGILAISERLGLERKIEILLARLKKSTRDATPTVYSINTDFHVEIEMERILSGDDKLQISVYPVDIIFSKHVPVTNVEIRQGTSGENEQSEIRKKVAILELKERDALIKELSELSSSKLVETSPGRLVKVKNSTYVWPYNIICGICNEEKMLRADALTAGRIRYFKTRHYNKCTAELRKSEKDKRQLSIFDTMRGTQVSLTL